MSRANDIVVYVRHCFRLSCVVGHELHPRSGTHLGYIVIYLVDGHKMTIVERADTIGNRIEAKENAPEGFVIQPDSAEVDFHLIADMLRGL